MTDRETGGGWSIGPGRPPVCFRLTEARKGPPRKAYENWQRPKPATYEDEGAVGREGIP